MSAITSNKIVLGLVIGVVTLIGLWGVWKLLNNSGSQSDSGQVVDLKISESDWKIGSASGSATLVEYSDFQCPACKSYAPLVEELLKKNGEKINFVYRHYPLPQHAHAQIAAYYAEAAGEQGKFFEMHDLLFAGQQDWEDADKPETIFLDYAKELKLNTEQLKKDAGSEKAKKSVADDLASGNVAGVNATPTFFLNGKKIKSPQSLEEFEQLINER